MFNSNIIEEEKETNKHNMEVDYVTKRDGTKEEVQFDKILRRIKNLSNNLSINPTKLTQKVCSQIYPNIHTSELDELAAQICASLSTEHPDYGKLSSKIIVSPESVPLASDPSIIILPGDASGFTVETVPDSV